MKKIRKGKNKPVTKVKREEPPPVLTPSERAFEQVLARERTPYTNSEGYHFIRPEWHRYVYGGAKKGDKG